MKPLAHPIEPITFVVPVGNEEIYQNCFLSSPLFTEPCNRGLEFQILAQRGFKGAAAAFNDGLDKAKHDLIVFVHQDVILPVKWAERFVGQVNQLENSGVPLGAVGCIGCRSDGELAGHVYHRERQLFPEHALPARIQALDELLVAFRKSSGLRFDHALPAFFGYAPDICMEAAVRGLQNFVVDAPCIHETADRRMARRDIYPTWNYLRRKWKSHLPIHTPTGPIDGRWAYWMDLMKDYAFHVTGYTPRPWWLRLHPVKREDVLFAETLPRM
jgi:hypothetical protein